MRFMGLIGFIRLVYYIYIGCLELIGLRIGDVLEETLLHSLGAVAPGINPTSSSQTQSVSLRLQTSKREHDNAQTLNRVSPKP